MAEEKRRRLNAEKAVDGADPLLVSVSLGVTIPVGQEGANQYIKPAVEIRNVRVDQPVESQVKRALEAVRVVWLAVDTELEVQITEMVAGAAGQKTVHDTLAEIQKWIDGVARKNTKTIVAKVKELQERMEALEAAGVKT